MKKIFMIILILFSILFLFFICSVGTYLFKQEQNEKMISYCSKNDGKDCYARMFELLSSDLVIYNVQKDNKELKLVKFDVNPAWIPFLALQKSYAFLRLYDKQTYISTNTIQEKYKITVYEYNQSEDKSQENFFEQLNQFKSINKKCFLELTLLNPDNEFFEKLMEYSDNICGLLIFINIEHTNNMIETYKAPNTLKGGYILTARNSYYDVMLSIPRLIPTRYYKGLIYDSTMVLSYINKDLVDNYQVSFKQNTDDFYKGEKVQGHRSLNKIPKGDVPFVVTVSEILKQKLKR